LCLSCHWCKGLIDNNNNNKNVCLTTIGDILGSWFSTPIMFVLF
jgi:hypothetical protein